MALVVKIHGNVHRKTMQGRAANFAPMNKVVHGKEEVGNERNFFFNFSSF